MEVDIKTVRKVIQEIKKIDDYFISLGADEHLLITGLCWGTATAFVGKTFLENGVEYIKIQIETDGDYDYITIPINWFDDFDRQRKKYIKEKSEELICCLEDNIKDSERNIKRFKETIKKIQKYI